MRRSCRKVNKERLALRIIGGVWRGRRLTFADNPGLRPSPDRVRETLFNWLLPDIEGTMCLDLFAGSGALGFEAASRGAAHVVMVEMNSLIVHQLKRQIALLKASQISVVRADAFDWLRTSDRIFDIVFLDPPFGQGLLSKTTCLLQQVVAAGTRVYIETEYDLPAPDLPEGWEYLRCKKAGLVKFYLAVVKSG